MIGRKESEIYKFVFPNFLFDFYAKACPLGTPGFQDEDKS